MSVKNITQALATQGGELVPLPPPKIDLRVRSYLLIAAAKSAESPPSRARA
jgi:hypothetical protein